MVLASTVVGLALAEVGASAYRGHAYPFLNVFVADERYGVRLEPGAETRTRSRQGHVTRIVINAAGFRGPEWSRAESASPVPGRVMILGDSQVFGYGVAWEDTASVRLGGDVLTAAVPSWGPPEYVRAIEELGPSFRPSYVVFVANAANDWSEAGVPNARRSTARDGWLVQGGAAGASLPTWFPGRTFLMQRSQLVLMGRRLAAHARDDMLPPADAATRLLREAGQPSSRSRMKAALLAARTACEGVGCRVVAAALPLDVQVHPGEWAKYRGAPIALDRASALLDDFVADARAEGIPAVNLTPALQASSPGAFLPDDYHLSPEGHRAVARALTPLLREATPTAALAPTVTP
jgi:hypothetical protein